MSERISLKDYVHNAILEDILSYRLKPGEIINEKSMVERFGCSKSPVREALLTLCNENVLRSLPRYGYEVVRLTQQEIREMMEIRMVLELGFVQKYYHTITEEQIRELESINEKCMDENADAETHWKYNTQFHLKLMEYWGNEFAVDALGRCLFSQTRAYIQSYWEKERTTAYSLDTRHHAEIIAALRAKDLDGLVKAIRLDYHDFGGPDSFTMN